MVAVGVLPAVIFFIERGDNSMSGDEAIEKWLLVALVVLFVQVLAIYLAIKTGEKIHEKRMKEIKKKRTGLKPVLIVFLLSDIYY